MRVRFDVRIAYPVRSAPRPSARRRGAELFGVSVHDDGRFQPAQAHCQQAPPLARPPPRIQGVRLLPIQLALETSPTHPHQDCT